MQRLWHRARALVYVLGLGLYMYSCKLRTHYTRVTFHAAAVFRARVHCTKIRLYHSPLTYVAGDKGRLYTNL